MLLNIVAGREAGAAITERLKEGKITCLQAQTSAQRLDVSQNKESIPEP